MTNLDDPPPRSTRAAPTMGLGRAIRTCMVKYATFSGRASRSEYWWFILFVFLGQAATGVIDGALFGEGAAFLAAIFGLATALPALAAGWRRMHDSGRSGLYLFYPLIVILGITSFGAFAMGIPEGRVQDVSMIVLVLASLVFVISPLLVLWWLTRASEPRPNRYGPPPSEVMQ